MVFRLKKKIRPNDHLVAEHLIYACSKKKRDIGGKLGNHLTCVTEWVKVEISGSRLKNLKAKG